MTQQKIITHTNRLYLGKCPYVRDMYEILKSLEAAYDIESTNVRIFAHANGVVNDVSYRPRLFRNKHNLTKHYHSNEPQYTPHNQESIEEGLEKVGAIKDFIHSQGERPLSVAAFELLDEEDKGGSYIEFKDLEGLVKGRIDYVQKEFSPLARVGNVLEVGLGVLAGMCIVGVGTMKVIDSIKAQESTFGGYVLITLGGLVGLAAMADAFRRIYTNNAQYLQTTITPVNDSEKAVKKTKDLADMLKEKF